MGVGLLGKGGEGILGCLLLLEKFVEEFGLDLLSLMRPFW